MRALFTAVLVLTAPLALAQDVELTRFVLEADDLEARPGDRLEVEWVVRNNGPDEINFGIGFYLSGDAEFSTSDLFLEGDAGDADPGQSDDGTEQMTLPTSVTAGCYFVLGFADNQDGIAETDETNNLRAVPIAVDRTTDECANATSSERDREAAWSVGRSAPNPVASQSSVDYVLGRATDVRLDLVDNLGRTVATLASGPHAVGAHRAALDASELAPGVYALVLRADDRVWTELVTVVR